jgi:serine/threonine-protein kinase TNNI3K
MRLNPVKVSMVDHFPGSEMGAPMSSPSKTSARNEHEFPQDTMVPITQAWLNSIGLSGLRIKDEYCCLEVDSDFFIHIRYARPARGIFFTVEIGKLPPSFERQVLLYYLQLNGSPECDGISYAFNMESRKLAFHRLLPRGFITLPNFRNWMRRIMDGYEQEKRRLVEFGQGCPPPLPTDSTKAISLEEKTRQVAIVNGYLRELAQKLHLTDLTLNSLSECYLAFDRVLRVKISLLPDKGVIKLYGWIGSIPELTVGQCVACLSECFFWVGTSGASVSFDPQNGDVSLVRFLSLQFLAFDLFCEAIENFVNALEYWHTKEFAVVKSTEPTLPPESRDVDQPNPESIPISPYLKDFSPMRRVRVLRHGQFGSVTLVKDPLTHETFVLESYDDMTDCGRFMAEVEILIRASHPCVVNIIGFSLPAGNTTACIAMKPSPKGSLRSLLNECSSGSIPEWFTSTACTKIICGIVLGMRFVHSRKIIHCDLRPENIFLDESYHAQIGSFGSGSFADVDMTLHCGETLESARYMAPELYEVQSSPAVDVYSFSLILYELLTFRRVFSTDLLLRKLSDQVQHGNRPEVPDDINPIVKIIIMRGWGVDPTVRPSFDEILRDLKSIQFKIRPTVGSEKVLHYVDSVELTQSDKRIDSEGSGNTDQ